MYPPEKSNKGNEKSGKGLLVILCISVNYFMRIDLNESIISKNDNGISKRAQGSPVQKLEAILNVCL